MISTFYNANPYALEMRKSLQIYSMQAELKFQEILQVTGFNTQTQRVNMHQINKMM